MESILGESQKVVLSREQGFGWSNPQKQERRYTVTSGIEGAWTTNPTNGMAVVRNVIQPRMGTS
jgi:catalase (peroxidase I)